MTDWLIVLAGSYLLGGVPFSYIAGRMHSGIDLRKHGSGNLGASNTFRILGGKIAIAVLALDIAKGVVPVWLSGRLDLPGGASPHTLQVAAMFFAILGHMFSPYLKFSGGKGIATSAGAFAALDPPAFLGAFAVFAIVFSARRIVSLASLSAAVALPILVFIAGRTGLSSGYRSTFIVSLLIMAVVVYRHRGNIKRLASGTEPALRRHRDGSS